VAASGVTVPASASSSSPSRAVPCRPATNDSYTPSVAPDHRSSRAAHCPSTTRSAPATTAASLSASARPGSPAESRCSRAVAPGETGPPSRSSSSVCSGSTPRPVSVICTRGRTRLASASGDAPPAPGRWVVATTGQPSRWCTMPIRDRLASSSRSASSTSSTRPSSCTCSVTSSARSEKSRPTAGGWPGPGRRRTAGGSAARIGSRSGTPRSPRMCSTAVPPPSRACRARCSSSVRPDHIGPTTATFARRRTRASSRCSSSDRLGIGGLLPTIPVISTIHL
jgi:hypothetical protein